MGNIFGISRKRGLGWVRKNTLIKWEFGAIKLLKLKGYIRVQTIGSMDLHKNY